MNSVPAVRLHAARQAWKGFVFKERHLEDLEGCMSHLAARDTYLRSSILSSFQLHGSNTGTKATACVPAPNAPPEEKGSCPPQQHPLPLLHV